MQDEEIHELCAGCPDLMKLDIFGPGLTFKSVHYLAVECNSLIELDFKNNRMFDEDITVIDEGVNLLINKAKQLKKLRINGMSDKAFLNLEPNYSLEYFHFNSALVTKEGIKNLLNHCYNLKFHLQRCNLKQTDIDKLKSLYPFRDFVIDMNTVSKKRMSITTKPYESDPEDEAVSVPPNVLDNDTPTSEIEVEIIEDDDLIVDNSSSALDSLSITPRAERSRNLFGYTPKLDENVDIEDEIERESTLPKMVNGKLNEKFEPMSIVSPIKRRNLTTSFELVKIEQQLKDLQDHLETVLERGYKKKPNVDEHITFLNVLIVFLAILSFVVAVTIKK